MTKFNLNNLVKQRQATPLKLLIYGDNGVGKSTFASHAPNPVFLDLERNINHLDVARQKLSTLQEVNEFLDLLHTQEHNFKTVVIDSLSALEQQIWADVATSNGVSHISKINYGKGYAIAQGIWNLLIAKLESLWEDRKLSLIMIAHTKTSPHEDPIIGAGYERFDITLRNDAATLIRNWCNCILFARCEVSTIAKDVGFGRTIHKAVEDPQHNRKIYTAGYGSYLGKNTFNLPVSMPMDYAVFIQGVRDYFNQPTTKEGA